MRYTIYLIVSTFLLSITGCGSSTDDIFADAPSYSSHDVPVRHVVHISIDGLRPDAVARWLDDLPGYNRLRSQGAFTHNARTTPTMGNTLPNHTSQLTGRVVAGPNGHGWDTNRYPDPTVTIHSKKGAYIASVFDAVSDAGLQSVLFASKEKFAVFENSYKGKIDAYVYEKNTRKLTDQFIDSLRTGNYSYSFLHFRNTDTSGHKFGWRIWSWHPYAWAVRKSDQRISSILKAIDDDPVLRGTTAVIVTADHGGHGHNHGPDHPLDYTIPFYVWGPGIPQADLYNLAETRVDPGEEQIPDGTERQPIRNGDAANLALALLGLDPVPGSTIGAEVPLIALGTNSAAQP